MGGGYFGKSTFKPDRFRLPLDLPFCFWPKPLRYSEMCSFQGMYILLDFAKNGQFSPKQRKWQEHPNMSNPYQGCPKKNQHHRYASLKDLYDLKGVGLEGGGIIGHDTNRQKQS